MLRTGLQMLLVTLLSFLALKASPARQWQNHPRSAKPQSKRPAKAELMKVFVRAPDIRPDGKQHDRLEDFDPDELKRLPLEKARGFLSTESPPDLAVLVFRIGAKEPELVACTHNQNEVFFQMMFFFEPFAIVVLDRDGDGLLLPGRFHDIIGIAIVVPDGSSLSEQQRGWLARQTIDGIRKLGVQSNEFATQRRPVPQIPRNLPTVNLRERQVTECYPNGKDGMSLVFDLAEVSASQGN